MLSKNNWLTVSWDGKIPRTKNENFVVSFNRQAESVPDFNQICDDTAKEIASQYDNLYLAFSGGADSEHVANVLYRNNIKFVPVIMILGEASTPESDLALSWCKDHDIEPLVLNYSYDILDNGVYFNLIKTYRARLMIGVTPMLLIKEVEQRNGHLITGMQLEYHPDEQFDGNEGIPKDYKGFVFNECDAYFEVVSPDKHPWAFFYWSPEIMASTVHNWDTALPMTEAKEKLYGTAFRPKMINRIFLRKAEQMIKSYKMMLHPRKSFGTIDSALMGDKQELIKKLVK